MSYYSRVHCLWYLQVESQLVTLSDVSPKPGSRLRLVYFWHENKIGREHFNHIRRPPNLPFSPVAAEKTQKADHSRWKRVALLKQPYHAEAIFCKRILDESCLLYKVGILDL